MLDLKSKQFFLLKQSAFIKLFSSLLRSTNSLQMDSMNVDSLLNVKDIRFKIFGLWQISDEVSSKINLMYLNPNNINDKLKASSFISSN